MSVEHFPGGRSRGRRVLVAGDLRHPMLERAAAPRRHRLLIALGAATVGALLPIVIGVVYLLTNPADLRTVAIVGGALALLVGGLTLRHVGVLGVRDVQAGAAAVAVVDGAGRGPLVELYRLHDVDLRDTRTGPSLRLTDADGATTVLPCGLAEANPELWALVHLGIRHSVADGADIDASTRERLSLH